MAASGRRRIAVALCAAFPLLLAACGAAPPHRADPHAQARELTVRQAGRVLAAFDQADSAASTSANVAALRTQEVPPALDDSLAAIHRARANHAAQPPYWHSAPVFAIPARGTDCFLVAATLHVRSDPAVQYDVSEFVRTGAAWRLKLHVLVGQSAQPELGAIGARSAVLTSAVVSAARRGAITSQIFARTTATRHPDHALVAASVVLDQELAVGWIYYRKQLAAEGMTVTRAMTGSAWSACAGRVRGAVIGFLTIYATDTVTPLPGRGQARLLPSDPDLIGVGRTTPVHGAAIDVHRVEEFLLAIPDSATSPVVVLGLVDAPISVRVGSG